MIHFLTDRTRGLAHGISDTGGLHRPRKELIVSKLLLSHAVKSLHFFTFGPELHLPS